LSGLSISGDGRWAAFTTSQPERTSLSMGALLSLDTGEVESPLAPLDGFGTFDTVFTADGADVVVSTVADLDPAVGNADGNAELFLLNRQTGALTRLTETIGNSTQPVFPAISDDGRAAAFRMINGFGECPASGPQRDEATGFYFGRVYTVPRRPGNHPPALDPVADVRVSLGENLSLEFRATDEDGDRIVFFLQPVDGVALPDGASLADAGDGSAHLSWYPCCEEDVGDYRFRLGAFDSAGDFALREFSARVCSAFDSEGNCLPSPTETPTETSTAEPTLTPTPGPSPSATVPAPPSSTATRSVTRTPAAATPTAAVSSPSATPTASTPVGPISGDNGCQVGRQSRATSGPWLMGPAWVLWRRRRRQALR
jgi:hypothetical protein